MVMKMHLVVLQCVFNSIAAIGRALGSEGMWNIWICGLSCNALCR